MSTNFTVGFCTVCTLTYASPSFIILIRSVICLPANGPSKSFALKLPCDVKGTIPLGVGEVKNVNTIGPFSPALPLYICAIVL